MILFGRVPHPAKRDSGRRGSRLGVAFGGAGPGYPLVGPAKAGLPSAPFACLAQKDIIHLKYNY